MDRGEASEDSAPHLCLRHTALKDGARARAVARRLVLERLNDRLERARDVLLLNLRRQDLRRTNLCARSGGCGIRPVEKSQVGGYMRCRVVRVMVQSETSFFGTSGGRICGALLFGGILRRMERLTD